MDITSIEVIKRNPALSGVGVPVTEKLPVSVGDTVRVHTAVRYKGPAIDGAVWVAIGWQTGIIIPEFVEAFASRTPVHFDASADWVTYAIDCDIVITDISGYLIEFALYGYVLDMYAKIMEVPGPDIFTDVYRVTTELLIQVELLEETIYPFAWIYDGPSEKTTFSFKSDPFTPDSWIIGRLAEAVETEVRKAGGMMLEMRIYVDRTPAFWNAWEIEVIGVPPQPSNGVMMSVGIAWWGIAILAALAITLIIVITWAVGEVFDMVFNRKPGLHEVKPGWTKDTLVGTIQDSEAYWERTLTPVETLEGMSEEELRVLLDEIADEEVETGGSMVAVAIVAAVAVVGVGAALALSAGAGRGKS